MALENTKFVESYCRLFDTDVVGIVDDNASSKFFFEQFYERFLAKPHVAALFKNTDMKRQIAMLRASLFQLTSCATLGRPSRELAKLAELHARIGIDAQLMDDWFEALIETVAFADPLCDEVTKYAWCWAVAPGIFYLQSQLTRRAPLAASG